MRSKNFRFVSGRYCFFVIILSSIMVATTFIGCDIEDGQAQEPHQIVNASSLQAALETYAGNIITASGLKFKDLNKNAFLDPYEDWRLSAVVRAADLVSKLTIPEKVGLMLYGSLEIGSNGEIVETPGIFDPGTTKSIIDLEIRHFLTSADIDPEKQAEWSNKIQQIAEESRMGIPLNIASDPRHHISPYNDMPPTNHSTHSMWPLPIGMAATRDTNLVRQFGQYAAQEYRAVGIHTALHPMADLATEPRWPRIYGTFGEDASLAGNMVAAYIRGFQGLTLSNTSVACMTKHWPGGGPQEDGFDPHNSFGKNQLYNGGEFDYHLIPFDRALTAGTAAVMSYYGIPVGIDTVGMGFSDYIINNLLRVQRFYNGVVCTDWRIVFDDNLMALSLGMPWGMENASKEARHEKILNAGSDQIGGSSDPTPLLNLVRSDTISEERINLSVRRLLKNMFQLGLFEDPYLDPKKSATTVGNNQILKAAMNAQHKSIVLLKNSNNVLPLKRNVNLYIPQTTMPSHETAGVYQDKVMLDAGVAERYATVVDDPASADAAIVMVSAPFAWTVPISVFQVFRFHEGTLAYSGAENEEHLNIIDETVAAMEGKPVIVVMHMDRPAILSEFIDSVDGMLATFGVSEEALFDVIFGSFNPVGKLPFDLPADMGQVEAQNEDAPFDLGSPLFSFGYGLSYVK